MRTNIVKGDSSRVIQVSNITHEEFETNYKPKLDEFGSWKHYETYGEDLEYISKLDDKYVWTVCEEDGIGFLQNGAWRVNRIYHIVCELPCNLDNGSLSLRLWDEKEILV